MIADFFFWDFTDFGEMISPVIFDGWEMGFAAVIKMNNDPTKLPLPVLINKIRLHRYLKAITENGKQ